MDYLNAFDDVAPADRELAERTRALLDERVMPRVADLYEAGQFPADLIPALAEIGLLGAHVPGRERVGALAWGLALRELERADSGLRSFVSVQSCLAMTAIARFGSEAQREEWLPPMAAGHAIGCFSLTEPDHGSDPGRHGDARRAHRERLAAERPQALGDEQPDRAGRGDLGADRPGARRQGGARLPGAAAAGRGRGLPDRAQALAAHLVLGRDLPARRRPAGRGGAAGRDQPRRPPSPAASTRRATRSSGGRSGGPRPASTPRSRARRRATRSISHWPASSSCRRSWSRCSTT